MERQQEKSCMPPGLRCVREAPKKENKNKKGDKINMTKIEEIKKLIQNQNFTVYTHSGTFHADDAFACAIAMLVAFKKNLKIVRCKNLEDLKRLGVDDSNALIVDIGLGRFDHHQSQKEYYDDGVEKSAVAKLWDYVGQDLIEDMFSCPPVISERVFEKLTENFIKPISDTDTRGQKLRPNAIYRMIMNRTNTEGKLDSIFVEIVEKAQEILYYEMRQVVSEVETAMEAISFAEQFKYEGHPGWGFTPTFVPASAFEGTAVRFIIGRSARGGYNIACVDAENFPIPECLEAPIKDYFWANYPERKAAEKAAAWLDQYYSQSPHPRE